MQGLFIFERPQLVLPAFERYLTNSSKAETAMATIKKKSILLSLCQSYMWKNTSEW